MALDFVEDIDPILVFLSCDYIKASIVYNDIIQRYSPHIFDYCILYFKRNTVLI